MNLKTMDNYSELSLTATINCDNSYIAINHGTAPICGNNSLNYRYAIYVVRQPNLKLSAFANPPVLNIDGCWEGNEIKDFFKYLSEDTLREVTCEEYKTLYMF